MTRPGREKQRAAHSGRHTADAGTSAPGGLSPSAGRGRLHPDPAGSGLQCPVGGGHPGGGHRRLEPAAAISDILMREMRSSAIFLGAILARCGQADISYPGGCELGPRPIDLHLAGLRELGAQIREEGGFLHATAPQLRGTDRGTAIAVRGCHGESHPGGLRGGGDHRALQRRPGAGDRGSAKLPQCLRRATSGAPAPPR